MHVEVDTKLNLIHVINGFKAFQCYVVNCCIAGSGATSVSTTLFKFSTISNCTFIGTHSFLSCAI